MRYDHVDSSNISTQPVMTHHRDHVVKENHNTRGRTHNHGHHKRGKHYEPMEVEKILSKHLNLPIDSMEFQVKFFIKFL